jgi:hypothetical protein
LQDSRKRDIPYLNCQMDMITHQAKGIDAVSESLDPLLDQKEESSAILVIEENALPAVAAQDDVVERPRVVNPWFASHAIMLYHELLNCKPDPGTGPYV